MEKVKIITINGEEVAIDNKHHIEKINKKRYDYYLKKSNIPEFYYDIEFSNYKGELSKDSLKKLQHYSDNIKDEKFKHVHLYMYGANNCYKTSLACALGKEAIRKGLSVKFILASSLINKLLKVQGFTIDYEIESYLKELRNQDILIIDDIFDITKGVTWAKPESNALIISAWDEFLRDIVVSDTKIVMTSNIPINVIQDKFGVSMYHLIDRNFACLNFLDSVKHVRMKKLDNLFKDIE